MDYLAKELNEYLQDTTVKATGKLQGSNNDKSNVEKIIKTKLIKEHIQKENNFNVKAAKC